MKLIKRDNSVLTGKNNLEQLVILNNFPVFFGCTDEDPSKDLFADMKWAIDPETGVIQLTELIPPEILYQAQHVDGIGKTWEEYYENFAKFIINNEPSNVLEIGGGAGKLAEKVLTEKVNLKWTIVEPNPTYKGNLNIKLISAFFDENIVLEEKYDTIIFSQVLEHMYDPQAFIRKISQSLSVGGKLIFAYPNLKIWVKRKYSNSLNFEHTMLLTDVHLDYILSLYNLMIMRKKIYRDHSIFYSVQKWGYDVRIDPPKNKYEEYKKIFLDFINTYYRNVAELNTKVAYSNSPIYLFGAHIFSQYLLCLGLRKNRIISILDNSKLKQGKRLYGTNFKVESPEVLRGNYKPKVILKTGIYNEEIKKDILENINPNTIFLE